MIVLGRIVGAYGIRGWVWVHPFADDPQAWSALSHWRLAASDDADDASWSERALEGVRIDGTRLAVKFAEVADRGTAEALKGWYVGVPREQMPAPAAGEYYWNDLVGMQVQSLSGELLGEVTRLISSSANDVLVVGAGEAETLIPFVAPIIAGVDPEQRVIRADWEKGW
jgi:16S rRNA processing protein RimM